MEALRASGLGTPPSEMLIKAGIPCVGFSLPLCDTDGSVKYYVEGDWADHPRKGFWCAGEFSLAYVALFLLFGGLSYRFNNSLFFKFKPVAISGVTYGKK